MGIRRNKGRWTSEEHEAFLLGLRLFKRDNWAAVAAVVPTRTVLQVRTHAQKYFNKVDKGEEFPEEPYPSQYDAEAGKSGVAAGAYLYGVSHQNQQHLHQGEQDIVGASSSIEPPPPLLPQHLYSTGGLDGSGVMEPRRRYSASLTNGRGHEQRSTSALTTSTAAAGPTVLPSAGTRVMSPPSTAPSSAYEDRGSSHPLFVPFLQDDSSRGAQNRHAYSTPTSAGVDSGAVDWPVGASAARSAARFAEGGGFGTNGILRSEHVEGGLQQNREGDVPCYDSFSQCEHGTIQQQQQQHHHQQHQQQHQQHQQHHHNQQQQPQQQQQQHHHHHHNHQHEWPISANPTFRAYRGDSDVGEMMNGDREEGQVVEDPVPFDGWLDTLLLGGNCQRGEYDDSTGYKGGLTDGDVVDFSAIDFGAL